jgi:hypothetical protein
VDILITNDFKVKILRFRSPRGSIKEDDKPMGTATDLFFIGTLLFELLNGKSIFSMEGSMVRKLKTAADVPILRKDEELNQKSNVFLRTVIYRCLTGQSEERYEGFNDLLVDLQKYIQEQVDMQDVRSSMELAAPEREDVAPMVESRASRQVVEMTDVPEDYRMENEADLARDYLLVDESGQRVMSMPEETGFALKLWLLLGFLLICATVFAGYVFY